MYMKVKAHQNSAQFCKAPADKFVEQSGELVFADETSCRRSKRCWPSHYRRFTAELHWRMHRSWYVPRYEPCCWTWRLSWNRWCLQTLCFEEAEHAANFAELLGEVVTDSTKKNLELRVAAEHGACAGKKELATLAKELGLDAVHDTVHEMAKDEARHVAASMAS